MHMKRQAISSVSLVALAALAGWGGPPVEGHTINVRSAAEVVRSAALQLGQVDAADCWRPVRGRRRVRHSAICVAQVHGGSVGDCAVFYKVRIAKAPDRSLRAIQMYQPWCAWPWG